MGEEMYGRKTISVQRSVITVCMRAHGVRTSVVIPVIEYPDGTRCLYIKSMQIKCNTKRLKTKAKINYLKQIQIDPVPGFSEWTFHEDGSASAYSVNKFINI